MAYIYTNTTSGSAVTLITRNSGDNTNIGNISKINISNNSSDKAVVDVYLVTDTSHTSDKFFYLIKDVAIPPGVALVLDDCVNYDSRLYNLMIHNTGGSPDLSIIIE